MWLKTEKIYGALTVALLHICVVTKLNFQILVKIKQENNLYVQENKFEHNELHISQDYTLVSICHNWFGHLNYKNLNVEC